MIADYTGFHPAPPILEMGLPANIQLTIDPCIVIVIFYNILDINRVLPASPITNVTFQVFQSYDWLLRRRYNIYSHPSRDVFCLYRCSYRLCTFPY